MDFSGKRANVPEGEDGTFINVSGLGLRTPVGTVYEDVGFAVGRGQVCSIFGDNGCGKTSLLLTVCGRMKPSVGTGRIAGFDLRRQYRRIRRLSAISFISGINDVQPFMSVHDLLAAELSLNGFKGSRAATEEFLDNWEFLDRKDTRFRDLAPFDEALFGIMLAMAARPQLLVVDDIQIDLTQHESLKLVGKLEQLAEAKDTTVLFACSEYEIARHADCIVVMSDAAAAQRRAVLRDAGIPLSQRVPVVGSGNGARVEDVEEHAGAGMLCSLEEGGER